MKITDRQWAELKSELSKSEFRSRFHLDEDDIAYIDRKGMETIRSHAYDFISSRVAPCGNINDGKQTPMKGHPVFKAQHATGTCCRGCLAKWHFIKDDHDLTDDEIVYVVSVIMRWIEDQSRGRLRQMLLF